LVETVSNASLSSILRSQECSFFKPDRAPMFSYGTNRTCRDLCYLAGLGGDDCDEEKITSAAFVSLSHYAMSPAFCHASQRANQFLATCPRTIPRFSAQRGRYNKAYGGTPFGRRPVPQ